MIFSLSPGPQKEFSLEIPHTDIFCFFHSQNTVSLPAGEWLHAALTSLRMKKNVLLLETPLESVPELNSSLRWQIGPNFLWLAPRSSSVLLEAVNEKSITYEKLKNQLNTFK